MYVVHTNVVDGKSMIGFPLGIADPKQEITGIKPRTISWRSNHYATRSKATDNLAWGLPRFA